MTGALCFSVLLTFIGSGDEKHKEISLCETIDFHLLIYFAWCKGENVDDEYIMSTGSKLWQNLEMEIR
jgi:hypothetical protein